VAAPNPTLEPESITANTTLRWLKTLADFPATESWQLSYTITPPTGAAIAIAWATHVTASGSDFQIVVPPAITAGITAGGEGRLQGKVTKASEAYPVYDATLKILVSGERTLAARILSAIDAMMLGNAAREERQLSVTTTAGITKSIELCSKQELLALRNYWQTIRNAEIAAERAAAGRGTGRRILNRYVSPS
jgi:hypothetical protein